MKGNIGRFFLEVSKLYQSQVIGILLIIVGIIFLYNPININLKVSTSLILIGFLPIILFDIKNKEIPIIITDRYFTIIIALWICLIFILTSNIDVDIFLIIVIIGILSIKIISDEFVGPQLKKRTNILFYTLIILLAVIIGQRIIIFLSI